MEYRALVGASADLLAVVVRSHINIGYKPIGGVSVAMDNYGNKTFSQAVIKGD